jgi:hypothetical protein
VNTVTGHHLFNRRSLPSPAFIVTESIRTGKGRGASTEAMRFGDSGLRTLGSGLTQARAAN